MDIQTVAQAADPSLKLSIGALVAALVALGAAVGHWVRTREDIARLQVQHEAADAKYTDLKEMFHRIEDKLEDIQGVLYHCRVIAKEK